MPTPRTVPVAEDRSHARCSARSKRTGEPCNNYPVKGANVCRMHGGATRQTKALARRRLAMEAAKKEAARLGGSRDVDPLDVLLEQVREAAANVSVYRLAIDHLDVEVGPLDSAVAQRGIITEGAVVDPQVHILVQMYDAERDRLVKYAKLCVDAGVDERRVRVTEQQASRLGQALGRALDAPEVGLTGEQRGNLQRVLAAELRGLGE
jgi:hypothetical protein